MKILNGRYLVDGAEKIVHLSEMNKQKYKKRFKGKLYCPTEGCPALLSYSGGKKPHFKTWRHRHHSDGCIYNVLRDRLGAEEGFWEDKTLTISGNRKQNALREAARLFIKPEAKGEAAKDRAALKGIRTRKANEHKKGQVQMTLYDGDLLEDDTLVKGKAIRKKFVDEIKQRDAGQVRLVLGFVQRAAAAGKVADLYIEHNGAVLKAVFPEEFINERLNSSYLNKFAAIPKAIETGQVLTFTGVGHIREGDKGSWELVIYSGADFKINNLDLSIFAKQYV
jgi:hypothetical protein